MSSIEVNNIDLTRKISVSALDTNDNIKAPGIEIDEDNESANRSDMSSRDGASSNE